MHLDNSSERNANRDAPRGAEVKLSAPTEGVDDRTDDCACGADDVAVPGQSSNVYVFK